MSSDQPTSSPPESASPNILEIYGYWVAIKGPKALPLRVDFNPMEIRKHLPSVLLVDVEGLTEDGTGIYRYRLAGEREIAERGSNPKGRLVTEAFYGGTVERSVANYETVRKSCAPHFITIQFVNERGIPVNEEGVLLPFTEDGLSVSQILVFSEERR